MFTQLLWCIFFKIFLPHISAISQQNFFFSLICNPLLVMCIWYKCSILLMIFIFWSIHGYYIRKEKNLCFSGVCQPNQKLFIDYLPVWGNSNLIFSQCPWCISSYGCWLLWALCLYFIKTYHKLFFAFWLQKVAIKWLYWGHERDY